MKLSAGVEPPVEELSKVTDQPAHMRHIVANLDNLSSTSSCAKWRLIVRPMQKAIVVIFYTSDNLTYLTPWYAVAPAHDLLVGAFLRWLGLRLAECDEYLRGLIPCKWEKVELTLFFKKGNLDESICHSYLGN